MHSLREFHTDPELSFDLLLPGRATHYTMFLDRWFMRLWPLWLPRANPLLHTVGGFPRRASREDQGPSWVAPVKGELLYSLCPLWKSAHNLRSLNFLYHTSILTRRWKTNAKNSEVKQTLLAAESKPILTGSEGQRSLLNHQSYGCSGSIGRK